MMVGTLQPEKNLKLNMVIKGSMENTFNAITIYSPGVSIEE
jgi:hypothetical protein